MIHDAKVEVTCDGARCDEFVFADLHAGSRNTYIAEDSAIEREIARDYEWIVINGKHYCSEHCSKSGD